MYDKCLLVISYYDRHPLSNLTELLQSILQYPAGGEFDVCIIVNRTKEDQITLPDEYSSIPVRYRYNIGMNIGAWDHGWRQCPNYRDYLFMQDECYVIRDQWLAGFRSALEDPTVGMVGESLNNGWSRPWAELRKNFETLPMPGHFINGRAANRVDCYLDFLHRNQVQPGKTARHLRSVVWFFPGAVLKKIDGFLIGRNYGECIAAEIATSKKVESIGLDITQAREEEFFYIRHLEYNQDRPGAAYTHDVNYVSYASVRKLIEARKGNSWNVLRLKLQRHLRLRPVKFFK